MRTASHGQSPVFITHPVVRTISTTAPTGLGGVRDVLRFVSDLAQPYTFSGDAMTFSRLLGEHALHWQQDLDRKGVPGRVLVPTGSRAPRVRTQDVRYSDDIPAGQAVITCGRWALALDLTEPSAVVHDDPTAALAAFERHWADARDTRPGPPTKVDHMLLPDSAARSGWMPERAILGDIRDQQHARFLLNLGIVADNHGKMRAEMPDVLIRYSVKSNPDPAVLSLLHRLGAGFEATSWEEVEMALRAGARGQDIIFSAPVKKRSDIRRARLAGVELFTVDSLDEIHKVAEAAPGADVMVRVRTRAERSAWIQLSTKFGVPTSEALGLLEAAGRVGLVARGITFNVGGQNESASAWQESLSEAHELIDRGRALGLPLDTVDMGGGFPVPIHAQVPDLADIASAVRGELRDLRYIAEPGRFIVGDAGKLVTPVVSRKERDGRQWLYVNASLFGTLQMMGLHNFRFPITAERPELDVTSYVVASLSCDGRDILSHAAVLPRSLAEGDLLIFHFVGAYSAPLFDIAYGGVSPVGVQYVR